MDIDFWIILVLVFGVFSLFFFPEPESNFLWYVLTGLGFVVIIGFLIRKRNTK